MSTPAPASPGPHPIRFGDFELDARSGELRNNGSRVMIAEQPLQVLLALIERPGELITRDELRLRLWPGDTFVDFEHGLNAAVKRLRDALGDSAEPPRYIETVPRQGLSADRPSEEWRVVSAERLQIPRSTSSAMNLEPERGGRGRSALARSRYCHRCRLARLRRVQSQPRPVARPLTRLTFGPGLQTDVTWSPDGRDRLRSDRGGNLDIWVQSLAGGAPVAICDLPGTDSQPAWSPNGNQIVFRSERDGGGAVPRPRIGGAC